MVKETNHQLETEQLEPSVESSIEDGEPKKKMRRAAGLWLRERSVGELISDKRRLVEVPYTATVAHTINALVANGVRAVPVAAPPGRWIGAGGSMILESDPVTGTVRKHYIGMATMLDVLVHIAEEDGEKDHNGSDNGDGSIDLEKKMNVPVSSVIGHSLEGLSLWTLNPNTSILDCMEVFSKGVHRALVPLESQTDNVVAVELTEASPGYRMLTQMDVLLFLHEHREELKDIMSFSIGQLEGISPNVVAVTKDAKVIDALKAMRSCSLTAVAIVDPLDTPVASQILQDGSGTKLLGTLSATDLWSCPIDMLEPSLSANLMDFTEATKSRNTLEGRPGPREVIACFPSSSLTEVVEKAVKHHVHRVWVVDQQGLLQGVVSLTDIIRMIREEAIETDPDIQATG